MLNPRTMIAALFVATMCSCLVPQQLEAQQTRIRMRAQLRSTKVEPLASGQADFEMRVDRIKFSTEAEDLALATSVDVFVEGEWIASGDVDVFGGVDIDLDSRLGDKIPVMSNGDQVEVFDELGQLILSGTFRQRTRR